MKINRQVCVCRVGVLVVNGFSDVSGLVEKMCLGHNVGILETVNLLHKFFVWLL